MANIKTKITSGIVIAKTSFECSCDAEVLTTTYTLSDGWEVESVVTNGDWAVPLYSESESSITINVSDNTTDTSRSAAISVNGTNGDQTVTKYIYVSQSSAGASIGSISASTNTLTYGNTSTSQSFTYTSTSVYDISIYSQATWAKVSVSGTTVTVTTEVNSGNQRESAVVITGSDRDGNVVTTQVFIVQASTDVQPTIYFDPSGIALGEGEEKSYQYATYYFKNCTPYSYVYSESWLHEGSGNILNDGKVRYYYDANTGASRTATITIYATSDISSTDILTATLTLTQDKYSGYVEPKGSIQFTNNSQSINYIGGTLTYDFLLTNITNLSSISAETSYGWITASYDGSGSSISVTISKNEEEEIRDGVVTVTAVGTDGLGVSAYIYVTQTEAPSTIEVPIWKDTDIVWAWTETYMDYIIHCNGKEIYSGRAYSVDGNVTIRVSDILRDKFDGQIDWETDGLQNIGNYIQAGISVNGVDIYQLKVYRDWSYNDEKSALISQPIDSLYDSRQHIPISVAGYNKASSQITMKKRKTGSPRWSTSTYNISDGFYCVNTHGFEGALQVTIGDETNTYNITHTCFNYCIYYLNSKGGYDSLLMRGKVLNKQSISILQYTKQSQNNTINHQLIDYQKTIKPTWEVTTSYLKDNQSKLCFDNIYGSTQIWLHDLNEDRIYPVVITNTSADLKTYKNQGRKMYTHTFNLQLSQDRYRI